MIIYSKVTDEPAEEPVSLDEVKKQIKMEGTSIDDTYLTGLIKTARMLCEADAGLSFISQERSVTLDKFQKIIILPCGPVTSVDSFTYIDSDGDEQTLTENTDFVVDLNSDLCRIQSIDGWPATKARINAVTIVYTAGYTDAASCPQIIKDIVTQAVANLHTFRTSSVEGNYSPVDYSVRTMIDRIRVTWNAWLDC